MAGCVVLLHVRDPLPPVRFGVGVGHRSEPARDPPITGQRDEVNVVSITRPCSLCSPQLRGGNGLPLESGGGFSVGGQPGVHESNRLIHDRIAHAVLRTDQLHEPVRPLDIGGAVVEGPSG